MQLLHFHIAYLLTRHECVIIPGLGAFVVSPLPASRQEETGVFLPPVQSVGFNPEIKHNDGLLAHSVAKEKNCSYEEAVLLIKQCVTRWTDQLTAAKTVTIPWLGSLSLSDDNTILFTPAPHLSCDALNFGFNNFYLPDLSELNISQERLEDERNRPVIPLHSYRKIATWTGSVAATLLALFLVATPLNKMPEQHSQNASFLSLPASYQSPAPEEAIRETDIQNDSTLPVSAAVQPVQDTTVIQMAPVDQADTYYYIVIASLPTRQIAKQKLSEIQDTGFPQAAIINQSDKHRIYVRQFEQKTEAVSYLDQFRRNHPKYATAWLLRQHSR
jgi:hypothetical protein